jgi:hypothetical protein
MIAHFTTLCSTWGAGEISPQLYESVTLPDAADSSEDVHQQISQLLMDQVYVSYTY